MLLKLNLYSITNMLSIGCSVNAVIHQRMTETFRYIVSLACSLFEGGDGKKGPRQTLQFKLDSGIMGPLYYTAMVCRDLEVSWAVVGLLRTHELQE